MRVWFFCITVAAIVGWMSASQAGNSLLCRAIGQLDRAEEADMASDQLIVHEWGTFTTFSGSDGVYLDFRPLASGESDLPDFVRDRTSDSPGSIFSKVRLRGKVRMETPVTYFYTDRVREVNVRVGFPQGLLTEFYPPVRRMLPNLDERAAFGEGELIGNSVLDWGKVTLIPISQLLPQVDDPGLRNQIVGHLATSALPHGNNDQHYSAARETDAALVHVRRSSGPQKFNGQQDYMEKFLFYRGVGRFQLPIHALFDESGRVRIQNKGEMPIESAILIDVRRGKIRARTLDQIDAHAESRFESMQAMSLDDLSTVVRGMLVSQGLYGKEASSMVETWKQSWFAEEGTRVLYIVPPSITDELLPLTVTPTPDETLRVLVGRMEIMSPKMEQELLEALTLSRRARAKYETKASEGKTNGAFPIAAQIQRFGRMIEPALVRISKITPDAELRLEAQRLITEVRAK